MSRRDGIPRCAEEGCRRYDGKRCELLGARPGNLCEPAVLLLVTEIKHMKRALRRWQTGNQIEGDYVPADVNTACGECILLMERTQLGRPFGCTQCGAQYDEDHTRVGRSIR